MLEIHPSIWNVSKVSLFSILILLNDLLNLIGYPNKRLTIKITSSKSFLEGLLFPKSKYNGGKL